MKTLVFMYSIFIVVLGQVISSVLELYCYFYNLSNQKKTDKALLFVAKFKHHKSVVSHYQKIESWSLPC